MGSSTPFWQALESAETGTQRPLQEALDALAFNEAGLIPAIAQQYDSGEVLMMAWMNREALETSIQEHRACYWSRSRNQLWRKGESSGQVQQLHSIHADCDGDTLLLKVDQQGAACHTGRRDCFYVALTPTHAEVDQTPLVDPESLYGKQ